MKKLILLRNVLLVAILIYYAQGFFYPTGSIISKFMLLVILLIESYFFIKVILLKNKSKFINYITLFFCLNLIGFILAYGTQDYINGIATFKFILLSLLSLYPFYYLTTKNVIDTKILLLFFYIFFLISIPNFFFDETAKFNSKNNVLLGVTNNTAYLFVILFPYLFLIKKSKILPVLITLVMTYLVLRGVKRGAILVFSISIAIYFFYFIQTFKKKYRILGFVSLIIIMLGVGYFAYLQYSNNLNLVVRIEKALDGNTSGRDVIYEDLFKYWINSDFITFLFGNGFVSTVRISGNFAHNDWLELAINFGLFGILLYIPIFIYIVKMIFNKNWTLLDRFLLLVIGVNWLIRSFISMGYTSNYHFLLMILIGYLIGSNYVRLNNQKNKVINTNTLFLKV